VKKQLENSVNAVVVDATQFGAHITAYELEDIIRWIVRGETTNGIEHMIKYSTVAEILYYKGVLPRRGGLADGSLITNYGDSAIMDWETWDALEQINLDHRIMGSLGNGDDKAFFVDTQFTEKTIEKMAKNTDRQFEPSKTWIEQGALYFSKIFWCPEYWAASLALTYNRLKFLRRVKIHGEVEFKAYVAVRTAMNFTYIEHHPLAEDFRQIVRSVDSYPIDELDDDLVMPAVAQYAAENTWLSDLGLDGVLGKLQEGYYATGDVQLE
jgi:hypothetical protein